MRLSHDPLKISARFDDPNLVSRAGLVPVMSLAERAGLGGLVRRRVQIPAKAGVHPEVKVACLVAGMAAGADSIDDMDLLRHGALPDLFGGVRAPSTLGSFLRSFTWGNVRQLEKAGRDLLAELARRAPLLPGAETLAFVDFDAMQRRVYGHKKQGAAFGHTKIQGKTVLVRGLNVLAATISTPQAAPVIAGTRLRGGSANTARGAASFTAEALGTARSAGCTGTIVARADSGLYCAAFTTACRRAGACFPVTARMDPAVKAAIAAIPEDAWTPIRYPRAIWDGQLRAWVSDAQIAEVGYTAFASKKGQAITARLIVRRVRDQNRTASEGQDELFPVWRYHPVFTDSPFQLAQAEAQHRDHAVVEQVFADWTDGPMAHLPSGHFAANAAWLTLAAMSGNLVRAAGCLASAAHARARGATIRRDLIDVAARTARHGRGSLVLHLPECWHREAEWQSLFQAACGPPQARAA
jgi:Transposase DDE domain group 1